MTRIATTAAVLALAGTALAQYEITIDVENPVLLPGESTMVTMYAGFDPSDWAMASIRTDFVASLGSEGFSDATVLSPMDFVGSTPGSPSASGYDGVGAWQPNALGEIYADRTNPIAFWQATYTAPVVGTAFDVALSTMTTTYDVYILGHSARSESRLPDLTEGAATIRVIPAPASALVLALGAFALRRRR